MARNIKPEYINKMRSITAPEGYKFDIANYLYNPDLTHDYPSFIKKVSETEDTETYHRVYYFKYHNGDGEYMAEQFTWKKDGGDWQVVTQRAVEALEKASRYNVNKLLSFCTA